MIEKDKPLKPLDKFAVAVILINPNGKILVGKKKVGISTMSGLWHIPGGTMEENESPTQTIIREIFEETGIEEIAVSEYVDYHISPKGTYISWYLGHTSETELAASDDLVDAKWVTKNEVVDICEEAAYLWPHRVREFFRS